MGLRRVYAPLVLCSALFLAGCPGFIAGVAGPILVNPKEVNLLNASYAAVDTIVQRSAKRFDNQRPLTISDLQEIAHKNSEGKLITNSKVGKVLSQQYRDRFTQLGYNVMDTPLYQGGTANAGEVSGTYEFIRSGVHGIMQVNLRLTDRSTGQVLTTYDYQLPITFDITKYMSDQTAIIPAVFN